MALICTSICSLLRFPKVSMLTGGLTLKYLTRQMGKGLLVLKSAREVFSADDIENPAVESPAILSYPSDAVPTEDFETKKYF